MTQNTFQFPGVYRGDEQELYVRTSHSAKTLADNYNAHTAQMARDGWTAGPSSLVQGDDFAWTISATFSRDLKQQQSLRDLEQKWFDAGVKTGELKAIRALREQLPDLIGQFLDFQAHPNTHLITLTAENADGECIYRPDCGCGPDECVENDRDDEVSAQNGCAEARSAQNMAENTCDGPCETVNPGCQRQNCDCVNYALLNLAIEDEVFARCRS